MALAPTGKWGANYRLSSDNWLKGVSLTDLYLAMASSGRCSPLSYFFRFLADLLRLLLLSVRRKRSLEAENLFLRRQLALYKERGIKPRRIDAATRMSLVFLSRLFDWRDALVVVRPETLIRWHRAGWRLLWRWKCRWGRPADSTGAAPVNSAHGNGEPAVG